jgi:hypothetical protein
MPARRRASFCRAMASSLATASSLVRQGSSPLASPLTSSCASRLTPPRAPPLASCHTSPPAFFLVPSRTSCHASSRASSRAMRTAAAPKEKPGLPSSC